MSSKFFGLSRDRDDSDTTSSEPSEPTMRLDKSPEAYEAALLAELALDKDKEYARVEDVDAAFLLGKWS
jgi:hypothetical protein